ncbi:plant/F14N23-31 protein [Senna tora]|uniref:Plant/F14N23-31 protein n=1 Tax=Senna tora TaxID=362788 RepID=A0A834X0L1_9FABA|nr:plant/F14N23-31 protein [Senna tora]
MLRQSVPDDVVSLKGIEGVPDCSSFANPAFQEIIGDGWFDLVAKFDSDCDDDYQSVLDDVVFVNGIEGIHGCSSIANPAFLGSVEESVYDDVVSLKGIDGRLRPNFPIKNANHENSFLLTKTYETSVLFR